MISSKSASIGGFPVTASSLDCFGSNPSLSPGWNPSFVLQGSNLSKTIGVGGGSGRGVCGWVCAYMGSLLNSCPVPQGLTKIEIFHQFWHKSLFSKILTRFEILRKFFIKIEIFHKFWPKSRFWKYWPKSGFFDDFDQNRDFQTYSPKFRFSNIFTKI